MNALALLGALLPVAAAFLLLQATRWDGDREHGSAAFIVALAVGLGIGMGSCTFFLSLVMFAGARAGVIAIDVALVVLAAAVWWRAAPRHVGPARPLTATERALAAALLVAALAGAASFLVNTLDFPHGHWDAWATWNLRARWLAQAGPAWSTAFAKPTIHGDYPLLLPAAVARLWVYGGAHSAAVPAVVAAAYAGALVLLLYGALAALRGRTQGLLGALCLLGTPLFLRNAAWQYADIPLAFNLLAALTLLAARDHDPGCGRAALSWAGLAAGLTAWTKNEGLVVVSCLMAARGALGFARPLYALGAAVWFLAGLLPAAALVLFFKVTLAPLSHHLRQQPSSLLARFADPDRYATIASAAGFEAARGVGALLIALAVYAALLGRTGDARARRVARGAALVVGVVALGYGAVYVAARAELTWLLGRSLDRLMLQLWPGALFVFFLYTASPSEIAPLPTPRPSTERPRSRAARRRGQLGTRR